MTFCKALVSFILLLFVRSVVCAPFEWVDDATIKTDVQPNDVPMLPESYEVAYTFKMPYPKAFQDEQIKYKVKLWINGETGDMRMDTLNGLNSIITTKTGKWEVVPRINETLCIIWAVNETSHLMMEDRGIPTNLTNWTYAGSTKYEGYSANIWLLSEQVFGRVEYYRFIISKKGIPLYLSAIGQDWFSGAHFDEYIVKFHPESWKPGVPKGKVFKKPLECYEETALKLDEGLSAGAVRMQNLIPKRHQGDSEYDAFAKEHGRFHANHAEYNLRLGIYRANKEHIMRHNARNDVSYTLGLNKFADWTDGEFTAAMLGRRGDVSVKQNLRASAKLHDSEDGVFPVQLDYQGTGYDGIVKDQAVCGSCWTFGAVGSMQAVWFNATGQHLQFSEQQIVDCAWDYGVYACDGGWTESAIQYVAENGGIMLEDDYNYEGQDNWCRFKPHKAVGFFNNFTVVPEGDVNGTKHALYENGPLGVSIDAGHKDFRFYLSGIFNNPLCNGTILNHVVVMVGYGEENGVKYFKIRNSWSKFWGAQGYMKVAEEHDCGVTNDAVYATVDKEKAKEAVEKMKGSSEPEMEQTLLEKFD